LFTKKKTLTYFVTTSFSIAASFASKSFCADSEKTAHAVETSNRFIKPPMIVRFVLLGGKKAVSFLKKSNQKTFAPLRAGVAPL
jgi:hypothetical protein